MRNPEESDVEMSKCPSPCLPPSQCIYDHDMRKRWTTKLHGDDLKSRCGVEDYRDVAHRFSICDQGQIICVNDDVELMVRWLEDYGHDEDAVSSLWMYLFEFDAVNCVTAILDGKTKGLLDFPHDSRISLGVHDTHPAMPLEMAADWGSYRLTRLFLDRGHPDGPSIRNTDDLSLPLNDALKPLDPWPDPTDSILRHFSLLCRLGHRHHLETVRLLAHHTKEVQQEFAKYAMEGSLAAVATLLLVAREKVMPYFPILRKRILEKITLLLVDDARSALTSGTDLSTHKRVSLQVILALFEIFENFGDKISAFLCVPKEDGELYIDIKNLFQSRGISVDYMHNFASSLSYRYLSELFVDQKVLRPTCVSNHEGDTSKAAVNSLEQLLKPKLQGQIKEALCADDADELVNLLVVDQMKQKCWTKNSIHFVSELLRSICHHNSVECAKTLLDGKTNLRLEINAGLEGGIYPLHLAAISLSPSLIELFLNHGARTNVQCNNSSSPYHGMFPLELALEALRFHRCLGHWAPTKSIFKLIYIFCLPELMGPLKAVELLASDIEVVQKISSVYVQKGKLIELTALLMLSWDMLVSPELGGDLGTSYIGKHISSELQMLLNQESKLCCREDTDGLHQVRMKKGSLLFAISMLEIFKRSRTAIQNYRCTCQIKGVSHFEVPLGISNLLGGLGFCLKDEDVDVNDIACLMREVESERSDVAAVIEKDRVHPLQPDVILPSDIRHVHINDDGVDAQEKVYSPMSRDLCQLTPMGWQFLEAKETKAFNSDALLQSRSFWLIKLPRQWPLPACAAPHRKYKVARHSPTLASAAISKKYGRWSSLALRAKCWAR